MSDRENIKKLPIEEKAKLLTGSSFWRSAECKEIGLEAFNMSDGPHGLRVQTQSANHLGLGKSLPSTCFPTASAMACSWDEKLGEELGRHLGEEALSMGVALILGPGLNVKRSPKCGRNFEYFSEDSYLSGKLAAAYVRGIQSAGAGSCIKHFAANSREIGRMVCDSRMDEQTLRETYLTAFEIAVKEGRPAALMTAYNKLNGIYCNSNKSLISGILRGEWGFDGLVVSDWGGTYDKVAAVNAGADIEMPRCDFSAAEVVSAVKCGALDEETVDESIARQLAFSRRARGTSGEVDWQAHSRFAMRCAENSLVLLKNDGGVLPLRRDQKIAVIGDFACNPRYQGAGSSFVNPIYLDNILGAIRNSDLTFAGFAKGFDRSGKYKTKLENEALRLADGADILLVCMGLPEEMETESCDRQHLSLPENQIALLRKLRACGKKIVVVLSCGGVVDTSWDGLCDGLIYAALPGQSGGQAIVNALCGKINPSGRLTETFPLSEEDVPCHAVYQSSDYKMDYAEGIYVGYKYYNSQKVPVKYPFGYGLSYTTFTYSDACLSDGGAYVTVTNSGSSEGAAVVQMYIKAPRPELEFSPAELKGFSKVSLAAGQSARVFIPFDDYSFRVWDAHSHSWKKCGEYIIYLGENSRDSFFEGRIDFGGLAGGSAAPISFKQYFDSHISPDEVKILHKKAEATLSTEVENLIYCRGLVAKIFGLIARIMSHSRDKLMSSSMHCLPLRFLLVFMKMNEARAEGFLEACNGHFLKGMKKIISGKR